MTPLRGAGHSLALILLKQWLIMFYFIIMLIIFMFNKNGFTPLKRAYVPPERYFFVNYVSSIIQLTIKVGQKLKLCFVTANGIISRRSWLLETINVR